MAHCDVTREFGMRSCRVLVCRLGVLALVLLVGTAAQAQQAPGWEVARQAIIDDYARNQPKDKVVEVTGPVQREAWLLGVRYHASALIERADRSRARDNLWVDYRLVGDRWELARVQLTDQAAQADVQPPTADQALRLFNAAWKDKCEGFDIQAIKLTDTAPRFQQETTADRANAKRWFIYSLSIAAKGNGKFRMSEDGAAYVNDTQNLLLWNPADKSWSVEPRQLRCSFVKQK